jgi:hypothetical protein
VGSRLIIVVTSMNCLWPLIEDLSTRQVTRRKKPTI